MKVTTFYSYKGGLGRTLMVAWTAVECAHAGRVTLAVDCDLEAPGLPFKLGFKVGDDLGGGLVGLLKRFQAGDEPPTSLREWVRPVPGVENLWLLPAGPLVSPHYWRDLASLSWKEMFLGHDAQGARFFYWLKERLEADIVPEHVIVDSRTGVTEMGGAALTILADQIVALLGTSEEGIHGTREVLRAVTSNASALGRPAPRIALALSRIAASMSAPDLQDLRRAIRDRIGEEGETLASTVTLDLPMVVRTEPSLYFDELGVLKKSDLRIHQDYAVVLKWLNGEAVPEDAPGPALPTAESAGEFRASVASFRALAEKNPEDYLPDLAGALAGLSDRLTRLGRNEEALVAATESLAIRRRLAQLNPD